jgi:hypothetical protein
MDDWIEDPDCVDNPESLDLLDSPAWMLFRIAIDWIVRRGTDMSDDDYDFRYLPGAAALIGALAALEPVNAEMTVDAILHDNSSAPRIFRPVPHGVWSVTTAVKEEVGTNGYYLIPADSVSVWGGSLHAQDHEYDRLRIRTRFVLTTWPVGSLDMIPTKAHAGKQTGIAKRVFSPVDLRATVELVIRRTPDVLIPLTIKEVVLLLRHLNAPRDKVRDQFQKSKPKNWSSKRGPRGPRQPDRDALVAEFGERIRAAELPK